MVCAPARTKPAQHPRRWTITVNLHGRSGSRRGEGSVFKADVCIIPNKRKKGLRHPTGSLDSVQPSARCGRRIVRPGPGCHPSTSSERVTGGQQKQAVVRPAGVAYDDGPLRLSAERAGYTNSQGMKSGEDRSVCNACADCTAAMRSLIWKPAEGVSRAVLRERWKPLMGGREGLMCYAHDSCQSRTPISAGSDGAPWGALSGIGEAGSAVRDFCRMTQPVRRSSGASTRGGDRLQGLPLASAVPRKARRHQPD